MRKIFITIFIYSVFAGYADADEVVKVLTGDVIQLKDAGRVHLIGIKCHFPFQSRADDGTFKWGIAAKQFTTDFVSGKNVSTEIDVNLPKMVHHGSVPVYLYVDGKILNEELLKAGLAGILGVSEDDRNFRNPVPPYKYLDRFWDAVHKAKTEKRGIFAEKKCFFCSD